MTIQFTVDLKACPLCKAEKGFTSLLRAQQEVIDHKYTFQTVQCQACGFAFQNPAMPKDEYDALYQDGTYHTYRGEKKDIALGRAFLQTDQILFRANSNIFAKDAVVLDIGCDEGFLLQNLKKRFGIVPIGVETRPEAVAACEKNGIKVYPTIQAVEESPGLVVMSHSLEHFQDPWEVITGIHALPILGRQWFYIEVPYAFGQHGPLIWHPSSYTYEAMLLFLAQINVMNLSIMMTSLPHIIPDLNLSILGYRETYTVDETLMYEAAAADLAPFAVLSP